MVSRLARLGLLVSLGESAAPIRFATRGLAPLAITACRMYALAFGLQQSTDHQSACDRPGDRQALPGFFDVLRTGKTHFQIGDNTNLFDWTYVDNVAHAHLLASDKLLSRGYDATLLPVAHLPVRCLGIEERGRERDVPTSEARGSPPGAQDYARSLPSTLPVATREQELDIRPVVRNKFDQFFHLTNPEMATPGNPIPDARIVETHIPVAGQPFFVTNGQPMPFWDFPRALWARMGHVVPAGKHWVIGREWGLTLAGLAETYGKITGRPVQFTQFRVTYTAASRYYNIEKARRALGYEPVVGIEEGIRRSVEWWKAEQAKSGAVAPKSG